MAINTWAEKSIAISVSTALPLVPKSNLMRKCGLVH